MAVVLGLLRETARDVEAVSVVERDRDGDDRFTAHQRGARKEQAFGDVFGRQAKDVAVAAVGDAVVRRGRHDQREADVLIVWDVGDGDVGGEVSDHRDDGRVVCGDLHVRRGYRRGILVVERADAVNAPLHGRHVAVDVVDRGAHAGDDLRAVLLQRAAQRDADADRQLLQVRLTRQQLGVRGRARAEYCGARRAGDECRSPHAGCK